MLQLSFHYLILLGMVPFTMVLGNSMLIPLLPQIGQALNLDIFKTGLLITVFSIPAGLTIPLAGFLSDRYGRKAIMVPALAIYGLGGLIAGLSALFISQPYPFILAGRLVQGIGAGGTYQLAMALTGDLVQGPGRTKALGGLEAANGLGKVVSPLAGAALGLISWFTPFFVYGVLAIPVSLAIWFFIREPSSPVGAQFSLYNYFQQVKTILSKKAVSLSSCFLSGMLVLFLLFGLLSYFSDTLRGTYNISGFTVGFYIAVPVGTMAVISYLAGTLLQGKFPAFLKGLTTAALALIAASLFFLSYFHSLPSTLIAFVVLGAGTGSILPAVNTIITGAASTEERGIITCLYGSMRFFGVALGPPAFSLVTSVGHQTVLLAAAGIATAVALFSAFALWHSEMSKGPLPTT